MLSAVYSFLFYVLFIFLLKIISKMGKKILMTKDAGIYEAIEAETGK